MKLKAGSLCGKYLVLYDRGQHSYIVRIDDQKIRWDIYCNSVTIIDHGDGTGDLLHERYTLNDIKCHKIDPMKSSWDEILRCSEDDKK